MTRDYVRRLQITANLEQVDVENGSVKGICRRLQRAVYIPFYALSTVASAA